MDGDGSGGKNFPCPCRWQNNPQRKITNNKYSCLCLEFGCTCSHFTFTASYLPEQRRRYIYILFQLTNSHNCVCSARRTQFQIDNDILSIFVSLFII